MENQTVIGVFDTLNQATSAKKALVDRGFEASAIDVSNHGAHGEPHGQDDDSGAIERFFENLFGGDEDDDYERRRTVAREVGRRGTVVTVHTTTRDRAQQAAALLDQYGAVDMEDRYASYASGSFDAGANRTALNDRFAGDIDSAGDSLEVIKEDVTIGKREVQTGGVTVRSRIVERPVEETLRLRTEHVTLSRTPVDRPADAADFRDRTISVTESAEEALVSKTARVVEEISVRKEVDTREETVHETARETEVDIERDTERTLPDDDRDAVDRKDRDLL